MTKIDSAISQGVITLTITGRLTIRAFPLTNLSTHLVLQLSHSAPPRRNSHLTYQIHPTTINRYRRKIIKGGALFRLEIIPQIWVVLIIPIQKIHFYWTGLAIQMIRDSVTLLLRKAIERKLIKEILSSTGKIILLQESLVPQTPIIRNQEMSRRALRLRIIRDLMGKSWLLLWKAFKKPNKYWRRMVQG